MNRFLCLLALLSMSACTVQDADVKLSNEYVFHDDYYYVFSSLSYTATKVHIIDSLDEYYFLFNSDFEEEVLESLYDHGFTKIIYIEDELEALRKLPKLKVHPKKPELQKSTPAAKLYKEYFQQYINALKLLLRLPNTTMKTLAKSPATSDLMCSTTTMTLQSLCFTRFTLMLMQLRHTRIQNTITSGAKPWLP